MKRRMQMPHLVLAMSNEVLEPRCEFLAPLDSFMWDRNLIEALFGFYYRWEIYTPASKRQYGYYTLPLLYGDDIVGRIEPIYDKQSGTLEIRNIWMEKGKKIPKRALNAAVSSFEKFNQS